MISVFQRKQSFVRLISYAFPNIIMMLVLSLYTIIDGIYISRYIGTTALSAMNMLIPLLNTELAISIMFASGGSAIIARKLGENKEAEAVNDFSLIVIAVGVLSIVFAVTGSLFLRNIITMLGANEEQYELSLEYGRILVFFSPFFFLQTLFQVIFVTAGKPKVGLFLTLMAGITNIILDYVFVAKLQLGLSGAALATGIGACIPSLAGLFYFGVIRNNTLKLVKPYRNIPMLIKACYNGSSEMVTNFSNAITTYLFNYSFLKYFGVDGVASITIVLYYQFIFSAVYIGFSMGVAPIISYNFGSRDFPQLKRILLNSFLFLFVSALISYGGSRIIFVNTLKVFTQVGTQVFNITLEGFNIFAFSLFLMGFSIFASALFTALSNGKASLVISFSRTFLFLASAIIIIPQLIGGQGLWLAVPVAEVLGIGVSGYILLLYRKKYHYF
ncbi:MATE family efflux transporter [Spirochaeta cellobiosiphila]|uniref:MATE family efflux transporter n=1 Tax=Spirochaeta cellobiosiphila TaxID=504483 RepID=UPI00048E32BD|nr:MATE family efflux transporter [Spirochaeta cellobiosiphila]